MYYTDARKAALSYDSMLKLVYEQHADALLLAELDGKIMLANAAASILFGYAPEEWDGMHTADLLPENDRKAITQLLNRSTEPLIFPVQMRRRKGGIFRAEVESFFISDRRHACILLDIREAAGLCGAMGADEQAGKLARAYYDGLHLPVFIHTVLPGGTSGPFLEVNESACRLLGYPRDELLSRGPEDILARESLSDLPEIPAGINSRPMFSRECVLIARDGQRIPALLKAAAIEFDGIPATLSIALENSETFLLREKNRQQDRLIQSIIDHMPAMVYLFSEEGELIRTNRLFDNLAGTKDDDTEGHRLAEAIPWLDHEAVDANNRRVFEEGGVHFFEERRHTPEGEETWLSVKSLQPGGRNGESAALAISTNITEKKHFEERMHSQSRLIGALAAVSDLLLAAADPTNALRQALRSLGEGLEIQAAGIILNRQNDAGQLVMVRFLEWEAPPEEAEEEAREETRTAQPAWEDGFSGWRDVLERGGMLSLRGSELSAAEKRFFGAKLPRACLMIPLYKAKEWCGFVYFCDTRKNQPWTAPEIDALRTAATLFGYGL
jgi:PAS domain S-box-containing protein